MIFCVVSTVACGCISDPSGRGSQAGNTARAGLENIRSYANAYKDYTRRDLEELKRFDIVALEPYCVPGRDFLRELKASGTVILAYVSIGEADGERRYWDGWKPTDRAPDNTAIPRTRVNSGDPMFIGEDPGWQGSYFVDAGDRRWQGIMLDEEIPYLLWLGGDRYDGLMMDLVDVVDRYEGRPGGVRMRRGMIDLVKRIRGKYPGLLLVPNRGFGILPEMAPCMDAFKFEEMTGAYGNVRGEAEYGKYYLKVHPDGARDNAEEIDLLDSVLDTHPMPVLVLDHVRTGPPDDAAARQCDEEARRLSTRTGHKFVWYGNSVDQDLHVWPFLELK